MTAEVDPEGIDDDLNPEVNSTDPAIRVLTAVDRVSALLYVHSYQFILKHGLYSISSERSSGSSGQVLNVAKLGHVRFNLCILKEATQARLQTIPRSRIC